MTPDEIKTRVRGALARVLKTDVEKISDSTTQVDLSNWDSVRHMNVVLALENEFEIEFTDAELPTLTSVPQLVAAVERRLTAA